MRARSIIAVLCLGLTVLAGPAFAQSATHVVQASETIYSIARDYNIAPDLLMKANGISNPRLLQVGTVLQIPSAYRVKHGDTLYGISRQFGVSLSDLLKANNFTSNHVLRPGETVQIPSGAGSGAAPSVASEASDGGPPVDRGAADAEGASDVASESKSGGSETRKQSDDVIGASAFEAKVSGDQTLKLPISAQGSPVEGSGDGLWPHSGKHYLLSGKFPGIMIKGNPGDPVTAVAAGRVIYTGPYTTFGRVVFIQSPDGFVYIYGGNGKVLVSPGDTVQAGTTIGSLGTIPFGAGSEVYFSVWRHNKFIDPAKAPRG